MPQNKNPKLYSVITGDIIKSSKLSIEMHKKLVKVLRNCSREVLKVFPGALKYEPELFRGDSWQLLIQKPEKALSIALFYRAYLKANLMVNKIDARMAVSVGTVDYIESSVGVGDAYKISGKALDKKGKRKIKFVSEILKNPEVIDLIIYNSDFISSRWTRNQSKIILLALQDYDQNKIALKLKISQQAVSKQLDSAGWNIISNNIEFFISVLLSDNRNII
ncbi:MAG: SatD family protein [Ignavibacterium sp.]|jgi:hypothetical protein|nr:SatD family protein [Ignavibacterium sp.]